MKLDLAVDFSSIKGQEHIKRAMEVAIAGSHSLAIYGQPGVGKTMLIDAGAGLSLQGYHTVDNLRLPETCYQAKKRIEQHETVVYIETWPCSCGYFGDTNRLCTCSDKEVRDFWNQPAKALLTAADMHLEAPAVEYEKLSDKRPGETSEQIFSRIEGAWAAQAARFKGHRYNYRAGAEREYPEDSQERPLKNLPKRFNSSITLPEMEEYCSLDSAGQALLKSATRQLALSGRAYFQLIKLARTIADLSSFKEPGRPGRIQASHIAEAVQYRRKAQ